MPGIRDDSDRTIELSIGKGLADEGTVFCDDIRFAKPRCHRRLMPWNANGDVPNSRQAGLLADGHSLGRAQFETVVFHRHHAAGRLNPSAGVETTDGKIK